MRNTSYKRPLMALTLVAALSVAACGDDVTGVDEHGEAAGVDLVLNGVTIASFSFATNTWTGEMEVTAGTETAHIDVNFVDAGGDAITYDADFYLDVDVENTAIADWHQDTPGEFGGHLEGLSVGETDVTFSLMHGAVGSGHADLVTAPVHAHVN